MKVKLYGTRGSVPVSRMDVSEFGGNTTCLRVYSSALPDGVALILDAGSGYVPMSHDLLQEDIIEIRLLFSHWHHDHTQGFCLAPHTFIPTIKLDVWGPLEEDIGPKEVFQNLMRTPYFPVKFELIEKRFSGHNVEFPTQYAIVIHPTTQTLKGSFEALEEAAKTGILKIEGKELDFSECLVVRMYLNNHPQKTISYRFEENSTGRVFVFLTDHENTEVIDEALLEQVRGANLLIQDCQYSRETYDARTAGFGHSTPDYCAKLVVQGDVECVGLTHHDPIASDDDIRARLHEMCDTLHQLGKSKDAKHAFACADYMEIEV